MGFGEWEMVVDLGWSWAFKVPSSPKQPVVLGEQVCAEGTASAGLETWGDGENLCSDGGGRSESGEWKIQRDEHHQSQE